MAMHELQPKLLKLLSPAKYSQNDIIGQIDKIFLEFGTRSLKYWRNLSNDKKNSLLHELVDRDLPDVVRHIVEKYEFDINIKRESDRFTPFQLASEKENFKMCDLLKELGAIEIESVDVSRWSQEKDDRDPMNIVWIDLEMTSIEEPEILECAVIITDKDLNELVKRNWVIHFEQEVLSKLSDWHQDQFANKTSGGNDLFAEVVKSKFTKEQVEEQLLTLLEHYCPEKKCPLAGSSIHTDKNVLKLQMPKVHDYLHYRIIDVSSFQAIMRRWAPWMESKIKRRLATGGQETVNHRAMDDIIWSISFMKEFRPILLKQQNTFSNANDRKDEPSIHRRRKRSMSPSLIARNLPNPRNNHAADDRIQLYSDEKRLLERLDNDKKFNVRSLNLDQKILQIYYANPHLREVFMNNQPLMTAKNDFTNEDRLLKLSSKLFENNGYDSRKVSTTEHWGQRKLLLTEIEFLTNYAADEKYLIVYAGAAPGSHINYLSRLFPQLEFHLIDTNNFSVAENHNIRIRQEKFTDDLAKYYGKLNSNVLFICNVRTFNSYDQNDNDLLNDMLNQKTWHELMKPRASLLNFRLPHMPDKMEYLKGDLVIEPWASKRCTECRLVVGKDYKLTEYDYFQFENTLFCFHNDKRIRYYEHDMDKIDNEGLDHCYDCRAEIFILQKYLSKIQRIQSQTELLTQVADMSFKISRKIADKNRPQIIKGGRTLDVIPKKSIKVCSNM